MKSTDTKGNYALCLKEFKIAAVTTMAYILICCCLCWFLGYNKEPSQITLIAGIPSWIVWGVVVPWVVMVIFTVIYSFFIMEGDDR
ncbi:MAG: DUF997 family protein [Pyramidobacter sp.]|jgi:uncharacterized protein involved in cysteine biosynthesis